MTRHPHRYASERAREWLESMLTDCRRGGRAQLPTLRDMARLAGVSYGTMAAVVRECKLAGAIRSAGRRGLFVAGVDSPEPAVPPAASSRWQRAARQIETDIVNGTFAPGEQLPSYKELESRYRANFRTLKRALGSLREEGLVREDGRRFAVPRPTYSPMRNTIALVNWIGVSSRGRDSLPPRILEHYRSLEAECSLSGVGLDVVSQQEITLTPGAASRRLGAGTLGCLVWTAYMDPGQVHRTLSALPSGMPVALLDESGTFRGSELAPVVRGPFRFFTLGTSVHDGTIVGRYLAGLGHRRVAWISPQRGELWSLGRETGLKRALERPTTKQNAVCELGFALAPEEQRDWNRGGRVRRALASLETAFGDSGFSADPSARRTLAFVRQLREEHIDLVGRRLEALFERALRDESITAWVCVADRIAVRALSWLRKRGVDVPGRVSVMGFDDSIEAFFAGLTSYNFNVPAVTRAMLNHVLAPPQQGGLRRERAVSVSGYVTVRSSTRAVG
ncbi:MAG: GntR family transcriptional regulator [Chitinivibrionales bacterium]|nr:GntR family transcriptional regulator [Chitinivibrionales bacterium]